MNTTKFKKASLLLFASLASLALSSCEESANRPKLPTEEGYLPLNNGTKWEYTLVHYTINTDELIKTDTTEIVISGDSVLTGKTYKKITGPTSDLKLVRKEGSEYFGIHHDLYGTGTTQEYKFLDESLPANSSWEFIKDPYSKTEYLIVAKDISKTINGVEYKNVIEVAVNYYYKQEDQWIKHLTIQHCYAKGIGEVYAFYPYPTLTYSDAHLSLLPQHSFKE